MFQLHVRHPASPPLPITFCYIPPPFPSTPYRNPQATVHWPIAFLTTSFTLDTLQTLTPGIFATSAKSLGATGGGARELLASVLPRASMISPIAHYANAAGILFGALSISTGATELYGMWKGQAEQKGGWIPALRDAYKADENDVAANKLKTTITHASMNDLVGECVDRGTVWEGEGQRGGGLADGVSGTHCTC